MESQQHLINPVDMVETLRRRFVEWDHSSPLVDALECVEDLAAAGGWTLGPVDGVPWDRWRSLLVAFDAIACELAGLMPAGDVDAACGGIADATFEGDGTVIDGVQRWLQANVDAGAIGPDQADEILEILDSVLSCALAELPDYRPAAG